MDVITRADAKAAGLTTYYTGKPCSKGHIAPRQVANWSCVLCAATSKKKLLAKKSKDPEYIQRSRERAKAWARANPERYKANQKRWREQNPGANARIRREWGAKNPERNKSNRKKWIENNPEKHKASRAARFHRRRARELGAGGNFSPADIVAIRQLQKGKCAACGKRRRLTVDHKIPLSRGGSNHRSNLQLLCMPCNSSKGAKDAIAWAQEKGRLL